jgi:hypothetical protein
MVKPKWILQALKFTLPSGKKSIGSGVASRPCAIIWHGCVQSCEENQTEHVSRDILNSFHLLASCAVSSELRESAEEAILVSDTLWSLVTLLPRRQRIPKLLGRLVFFFSLCLYRLLLRHMSWQCANKSPLTRAAALVLSCVSDRLSLYFWFCSQQFCLSRCAACDVD